MSLAFLTSVYTGNNQTGTGRVFGLGQSARTRRLRRSQMQDFNIYNNLSSAIVHPTSRCDATVILFKRLLGFVDIGDFNGNYLQLTNRRSSGSELDVNAFSSLAFNNDAHSMLLIAARRETDEFRISFRDIFLDQWRSILDSQLSGSRASRNGDPPLTWELWPIGISHLSSSQQYLKIHQRLRVDIPWWPDYDASITYHIRLYLDGGGHLRAYVARWAYWVESGVKSGQIADQLEPQVIAGMNTLNSELGDQLAILSGFEFEDLYYLPGDQVSRAPTGTRTGTTFDDVTIVLDRR